MTRAVVTLILVGLNLAVFLFELRLGSADIDGFVRRWGLVPSDIRQSPTAAITLLTSTFIHAGWLHVSANLIYLGVFGTRVERIVGHLRFAALYLVSGLVGSLTYLLAQPNSQTPAVGASGAIAGLIAAHLVLFLHVVESTPTLLLLLVWLAAQVLSSVASLTTTTGIAWWAHVGGFVAGLVLAPALRKQRMVN